MIATTKLPVCLVAFAALLLHISTNAFAQVKNSSDAGNANKSLTDTNVIVAVHYPPLTEREGKDLQLPLPPAQHPRLYFMAKDIAAVKEKLDNPLLQLCRSKIMQASTSITDGYLPLTGAKHNNSAAVRDAIEAKALMYILFKNEAFGKAAVNAVLNYFATLKIDPSFADVTREIGRAIVTGSVVYDWCYPLLRPSQKTELIGRMETLATQMEIEWPQIKGSSILGHTTEAQLARDMLSLGIATYNENPVIYQRIAGRIFSEFLPGRQFFYPAGYHHQGSAYGAYRFYWDMWSTFIFGRMGYPNLYGTAQQNIPYYFMYNRRPDGQLMRDGDDYSEQSAPFGKWWNLGQAALLFSGSYHNDPIVINEALKEHKPGDVSDYLFEFLFFNAESYNPLATKATLPLTRYVKEPLGGMIARTGWQDGITSSAVIATMKVQEYNYVNHQHLDAGGFQLYYKGPLAVQSGIYQGKTGSYGGEHFKNYSQRTIAHNAMLIYDSTEKFTWHNNQIVNDGGQPYPNNAHEPENMNELLTQSYQTGEVLAHSFGPDSMQPEYTYLKGELAKAYGKKVKSFQRSFVFLNLKNTAVPAALIVFDRVQVSDSSFKKTWLLHGVEEPVITGNATIFTRTEKGYNGKLINTTLLPVINNLNIKKVGGPGNEFSVQNTNFPQAMVLATNSWDSAVWRIEVSPKKASVSDNFLNVMQVMDASGAIQPLVAEKIETPLFAGTTIGDRVVLFGKSNEIITMPFTIKITSAGAKKVLITGIKKGKWKILHTGDKKFKPIFIQNADGLIYFTAKEGNYIFSVE